VSALPVMPGKGYSMTVDVENQPLRHPCILLEAKVAITPWDKKLRIGSTMEIGKINDRILLPRVQGILEAVPKYLPGYTGDAAFRELSDINHLKQHLRQKVWYGFRPLRWTGCPTSDTPERPPTCSLPADMRCSDSASGPPPEK
jgi:D-amino-acid dehydrogenase